MSCHQTNSNIVTDGFYVARTGLGPFGEGWEEKGEDVDWFLYNRLWGVGVFTLIEHIGLEPTEEVSPPCLFSCCCCVCGRLLGSWCDVRKYTSL